MQQISLAENICAESQVFSTESGWNKKRNRFGQLSTKEMQQITDSAVPVTTKTPQSLEWDFSTVHLRYVFPKRCKISNMNVEILRIHEGYVTTTVFFYSTVTE